MSSEIERIVREIHTNVKGKLYGGHSRQVYRQSFRYIVEVLLNPSYRIMVQGQNAQGKTSFSEFQKIAIKNFSEGTHFENKPSTWEFKKIWPYLLMIRNVKSTGLLHIMAMANANHALEELKKLISKSGSEEKEYTWSNFINQRDEHGYAPLHYATIVTTIKEDLFIDTAEYGDSSKKIPQEKMLECILEQEACVNLTTKNGHTPLDLILGLQQFDPSPEIEEQLQKKADILSRWGGETQKPIDLDTFELPNIDAPNIEFCPLPPLASRVQPEPTNQSRSDQIQEILPITPKSETYLSSSKGASPEAGTTPIATSTDNTFFQRQCPSPPKTPRSSMQRQASQETLSSKLSSSIESSENALSTVSSFTGQQFFFHWPPGINLDDNASSIVSDSTEGFEIVDAPEYPPEIGPARP
jgi:hypothetical protein